MQGDVASNTKCATSGVSMKVYIESTMTSCCTLHRVVRMSQCPSLSTRLYVLDRLDELDRAAWKVCMACCSCGRVFDGCILVVCLDDMYLNMISRKKKCRSSIVEWIVQEVNRQSHTCGLFRSTTPFADSTRGCTSVKCTWQASHLDTPFPLLLLQASLPSMLLYAATTAAAGISTQAAAM